MNRVGVVIDAYKLRTFEEVFAKHVIVFTQGPGPSADSLTLRVDTEDPEGLGVIIREANELAIARSKATAPPPLVPVDLRYELWSTETDRLLGTLELGNIPDHSDKARVVVKLKRPVYVGEKKHNAVEVLMCRMDKTDEKGNKSDKYWALETNLPMHMVKNLEGFAPRIIRPSLSQMFFLNRAGTIKVGK